MGRKPKEERILRRYGAAELFGRALKDLSAIELRRLAKPGCRMECPFKPGGGPCRKKGGVCSLALYEQDEAGHVRVVSAPVTTCPSRFLENNEVFCWVGKELLDTVQPIVVSEVSFLMSEQNEQMEGEGEVGRIDKVLVTNVGNSINWCALEMQAVYFSGGKMEDDFALMRKWDGSGLPFPTKLRRPDFRSSGPKRLMPQLQIKVPTLRRWGKKMAVVVDRAFWQSLGEMRPARHTSNADIVWFIVDYADSQNGRYRLERHKIALTTLENAVDGLTGGTPVSLEQFECAIVQKLARHGAK